MTCDNSNQPSNSSNTTDGACDEGPGNSVDAFSGLPRLLAAVFGDEACVLFTNDAAGKGSNEVSAVAGTILKVIADYPDVDGARTRLTDANGDCRALGHFVDGKAPSGLPDHSLKLFMDDGKAFYVWLLDAPVAPDTPDWERLEVVNTKLNGEDDFEPTLGDALPLPGCGGWRVGRCAAV